MPEEEAGKCELCGEPFSIMDAEMGNVAEVFDPKDPGYTDILAHGIIAHWDPCARAKGYELA